MSTSTARSATAASSTGASTRLSTRRGKKKELELFKRYGFRVVELADRDIEELDDRLPGKLPTCFPDGYRFHRGFAFTVTPSSVID